MTTKREHRIRNADHKVRYYGRLVKDSNWPEESLVAAQWFLRLAEQEIPDLTEVNELLTFLSDNEPMCGGTGWVEMLWNVEAMKRELEGPEEEVVDHPSSFWVRLKDRLRDLL